MIQPMEKMYRGFVRRLFAKKNTGEDGLLHAAVGLSGESGEVLDLIKKHWVYGKPLDKEKLVEELGDIFFYFTALLIQLDVDIGEVTVNNVQKLSKRYPTGYSDAAAIARVDQNASGSTGPAA
jgi:NTP pyrophosphatase (non-canonical NTP hydrolase)